MNINDKIYCYNNITGNKKIYPILDITIGKYYKINTIIKNKINIFIQIYDDKKNQLVLGVNVNYDTIFKYENFFLTKKEIRQNKLKQIQKVE